MKAIFSLFSRPFPYTSRQDYLIAMSAGTGLFVATFLLVFQPFGTAESDISYKYWKVGGFGLVSFIVLFLYFNYIPVLFSKWLQEKNWTVGKEILLYVGLITCIGIGNGLYSIMIGINPPDLMAVFGMFYSTLLVGIFPITFFVILDYIYLLKKNIREANALQLEKLEKTQKTSAIPVVDIPKNIERPLQLIAENNKDSVSILAENLLYLESSSNYVTVVFLEKNQIQKTLLRSSLIRLEQQINNDHILRCHRSFMVNLKQVAHISGNAQGYKLQLEGLEESVPVARKYSKIVADYFRT